MFLSRFTAVMVTAMVLGSATAGAGGPVRPFEFGFWSGGAYTDDRTGAFTHCSAGVAYDSGVNLFVLVTANYRWWLGFINPKWSFPTDGKTAVRLRLDTGAPFDRLATVPNPQLLLVPLPDSSDLIDAFRHGSELALDTDGRALFFKLRETAGMMDRLTGCVGTSLALENKAPTEGSQLANASPLTTPAKAAATVPIKAAAGERSPQSTSAPTEVATAAAQASPAATVVVPPKAAPKSAQDSAPAKTAEPEATASAAAPRSPDAHAAPPKVAAATTPSIVPHQSAAITGAASLSPPLSSAAAAASAEKNASPPNVTAASDEPSVASAAKAPAPQTMASSSPPSVAISTRETDGAPQLAEGSSSPPVADLPAVPAGGDKPAATPPTSQLVVSGQPALAFTALAQAPPPPLSTLGPAPATGSALEEVRLATEFLTSAQLPDAHLIVSDKPPALAAFAAVWRSEDAAGAVKIIPPGPDVSAIEIASNLIAVDPQLCKGDFTTARFHTDVGHRTVFSAVLSCSEANEERVTEYVIAPRQQGGFVVFAVIRSKDGGQALDLNRQNLEGLSRAAIQAVGGQG